MDEVESLLNNDLTKAKLEKRSTSLDVEGRESGKDGKFSACDTET